MRGKTGLDLVLDSGRVEDSQAEVAALRKALDCALRA